MHLVLGLLAVKTIDYQLMKPCPHIRSLENEVLSKRINQVGAQWSFGLCGTKVEKVMCVTVAPFKFFAVDFCCQKKENY